MRYLIFPGLVAAGLLFMSGCGSCFGPSSPVSGTGPGQPSPGTPLAMPAVQTPVSPVGQPLALPASSPAVQSPGSPLPAPAPIPENPYFSSALTLDRIQSIEPGMTYEQVFSELGHPGILIAGTDQQNNVYRWSESGMSFMGRFEDGILVRKSVITDDASDTSGDPDVLRFDRELFDTIQPGMTFDAVMEIIGTEAQPISADSDRLVTIYKWTDEFGSNITARFENMVLKRKSGLIATPDRDNGRGATVPDVSQDTVDDREDQAVASANANVDTMSRPGARPAVPESPLSVEEQSTPPKTAPQPTQRQRVHVVGQTRRNQESPDAVAAGSGRSYRPKAKLPDFTRRIRGGSYEIRIFNTTDSRARVAVIASDSGAALTVAARGQGSVKVPQGNYRVYFIYDATPNLLHQGNVIPIYQMLTDFAVYLVGDSYDVDILDRSMDRTVRPR